MPVDADKLLGQALVQLTNLTEQHNQLARQFVDFRGRACGLLRDIKNGDVNATHVEVDVVGGEFHVNGKKKEQK